VAVTAFAGALLAGVAAPGVATAAPERDRPGLRETMREIVDAGFLGVQLRVHDEQGDWAGSAGARKVGATAPPATNGHFRVGSATKAFASTLVLQLVDEGEVGLDAPAADHLPEYGLDRRITVRMLLQHTSGIFNFTGEYFPDGSVVPGIPWQGKDWVDNRFHTYRPEELVRFALSRPPRFAPGEGWSYSNTNYVLARLLIENVTGNSYDDELKRRILRPLGLRGTVSPGARSGIPAPHAHGYHRYEDDGRRKTVDVTRQNPTWISTGGDMISTTQDLSAFLTALLDGKLISDQLLAEMLVPDPRSPNGYGLGLSVVDRGPDCGGTIVNINGGVNGYGALTYSTLDGSRTVSASVTYGHIDFDFVGEGAEAAEAIVREVFCDGR
jgi:D-alanyl-D-alanine carboxypeptidase